MSWVNNVSKLGIDEAQAADSRSLMLFAVAMIDFGCRLDWDKVKDTLNTQPVLLQITIFKSLKLQEMRCLLLMVFP